MSIDNLKLLAHVGQRTTVREAGQRFRSVVSWPGNVISRAARMWGVWHGKHEPDDRQTGHASSQPDDSNGTATEELQGVVAAHVACRLQPGSRHAKAVENSTMPRPFASVMLTIGLAGLVPATSGAGPRSSGRGPVVVGEIGVGVEVAQGSPVPRPGPPRQWRLPVRPGPSQEPASARGYADGYKRGLKDGRDRDRYDPVGDGAYKSGDPGYYRDYGPREAYRNNYRSGFRQGYENGYRAGSRGRR
jgi:hypothetical protein